MNQRKEIKTFNDLAQDFIKISKVKNLSPKTLDYYEMCRHVFNKYCGNPKLEEINSGLITDYIFELKEHMKSVSINSRLRGIRAILNHGAKIGAIQKIEVPMMKYTKEAKEGYSQEEMQLLLIKPNMEKCSFTEYRNWVIINYLYGTGCRLSTLINIKVQDLDLENKLVVNRHMKNRRQIVVPLPSVLIEILREYLQIRGGDGESYLFPQEYNGQFTERGIKNAVRSYNLRRGVTKTSIHYFRHTWAKNCIMNGMDIFTLQKLGGWNSLDMVKNYVNLYNVDVIKYDELNPLEKIYHHNNQRIHIRSK